MQPTRTAFTVIGLLMVVSIIAMASVPGETAVGGIHHHRRRINTPFAETHLARLTWTDFLLNSESNAGGDANDRRDHGDRGVTP